MVFFVVVYFYFFLYLCLKYNFERETLKDRVDFIEFRREIHTFHFMFNIFKPFPAVNLVPLVFVVTEGS